MLPILFIMRAEPLTSRRLTETDPSMECWPDSHLKQDSIGFTTSLGIMFTVLSSLVSFHLCVSKVSWFTKLLFWFLQKNQTRLEQEDALTATVKS